MFEMTQWGGAERKEVTRSRKNLRLSSEYGVINSLPGLCALPNLRGTVSVSIPPMMFLQLANGGALFHPVQSTFRGEKERTMTASLWFLPRAGVLVVFSRC